MTSYTARTIPTTTYTVGPRTGDFQYLTWDETTDIWSSVTSTWDNWYTGTLATAYTSRVTP